jgi:hypothetical protein
LQTTQQQLVVLQATRWQDNKTATRTAGLGGTEGKKLGYGAVFQHVAHHELIRFSPADF